MGVPAEFQLIQIKTRSPQENNDDGIFREGMVMKASLRIGLTALSLLGALTLEISASRADCPVPPSLNQCKTCHALEVGKPSRATGPNLHGIAGQPALHAADFKGYSPAMKAAQGKGLVWSDENLVKYLADPKAFLAEVNGEPLKNTMMFQMKDETKRKAVIEGLKTMAACQ
jgi:cytochrome c